MYETYGLGKRPMRYSDMVRAEMPGNRQMYFQNQAADQEQANLDRQYGLEQDAAKQAEQQGNRMNRIAGSGLGYLVGGPWALPAAAAAFAAPEIIKGAGQTYNEVKRVGDKVGKEASRAVDKIKNVFGF